MKGRPRSLIGKVGNVYKTVKSEDADKILQSALEGLEKLPKVEVKAETIEVPDETKTNE